MRGLKCLTGHTVVCFNYVASLRDVWIKISIRWRIKLLVQSHPSWVRGLKQRKNICYLNYFSVAPFMDAWIKTDGLGKYKSSVKSHPSRVRGLKCKAILQHNGLSPSYPSRIHGLLRVKTLVLIKSGWIKIVV